MKQLIILFTFTIISCISLFAQNKEWRGWHFSLSTGAAIPVGNYAKDDAASAAIYKTEEPYNIIGFAKSESGFAKIGYYYNAELQYKFNNGIAFSLRSGRLVNSVHTEGLSNYLTKISNSGEVKVEHVDYNVFYVTPSVGYYKSFRSFDIGLNFFIGSAKCNYPYYKGILLYTTTDPPRIWAHDGERPNMNALMFGSLLNLNCRITSKFIVGLELTYQKANFEYEMMTRAIPGGNHNPLINDTIKLNVVNMGFKIGYKL